MELTSRRRWLAALRINRWIDCRSGRNSTAPMRRRSGRLSTMSPRELHEWIGSDQHEFMADGTREVRSGTARSRCRKASAAHHLRTPHSELTLLEQWDAASHPGIPSGIR